MVSNGSVVICMEDEPLFDEDGWKTYIFLVPGGGICTRWMPPGSEFRGMQEL